MSVFSGINTFLIAVNDVTVINDIKTLNKRSKADTTTTFDFSTLYTKIPHN